MSDRLIIAIDGYSSCGKSTIAKDLAKELGYVYVDTGAMYRATTLFALRKGYLSNGALNVEALINSLDDIHITFHFNANEKKNETFLNNESVEEEIRQLPVSNNVSEVSSIREVREKMVALQREIETGVVMDGRDIGTVVFPNADLKIFMTADPKIRAQRRYDELIAKGEKVVFKEIYENVVTRDHMDETRKESPLQKATDSIILDNSFMTKEEQLKWIIDKVTEIQNEN